jgi:aspartyl aminopeptidase
MDIIMKYKETAQELIQYINSATSPYQVVEESINKLKAAGFSELNLSNPWTLKEGQGYYVMPYATSLFAFTVGKDFKPGSSIRIAAAHTDHPGFRVKPRTEMISNSYCKLNTEVYGGPILSTWMDRPLSIAGRVALRSEDPFKPVMKTLDIKKPILTIPNMAIHINKDVNKGVELNKQTDTIPLFSMVEEDIREEKFFLKYLAKELNIEVTDILDYDMYIYNQEEGGFVGAKDDFISCPRLDNLTSCWALLKGIITGSRKEGINLIALYDNEEIGSRSKQGADSMLLNILLEKIYDGLGNQKKERLYEALAESLLISVDVAHGIHPNRPEKYDPTNNTKLNEGVVFKIDSNQRYTFDTEAIAIIQQICEAGEIKYQKFVNRSDMPGGGTLGPIISSWLPMKTVDLGIPLLAMHSARELMGTKDQEYLETLMLKFFSL